MEATMNWRFSVLKQGSLWIALVVLCVLGNAACGGGHHHVSPISTSNFVFYAAGTDSQGFTYSIAGVVQVTDDGNNTIMGGVQDFNDGVPTTATNPPGLGTSPQPEGDTIKPGGSSLMFFPDGSGNATLTLVTNNRGTEIFALAFANAKHALIVQFDGLTSLGSYDQQTLPTSAFAGSSFSFTAAGAVPGANATSTPFAEGGVFSLDGSGVVTGTADVNNGGTISMFSIQNVTLGSATSGGFGRGTISGKLNGITTTVNYYIVSPEVIRIIIVDTTDTAVGSAYGQGTSAGTFTNASIGQSVFSVAGIDNFSLYNAAGQFTTVPTQALAKPKANLRGVHANGTSMDGTFAGIADVNESANFNNAGPLVTAAAFNGLYDLGTDGRGSFNFTVGPTDDVTTFGVYAVDPTLNILDPNNPPSTTPPTSPALLVELDAHLIGNGLLLPQATAPIPNVGNIAPDVVFGAQCNRAQPDSNNLLITEFEILGAAATDDGAFNGKGFIHDPTGAFDDGTPIAASDSTFIGTFTDDGRAIGRYTSGTGGFTAASASAGVSIPLTVTVYDANGSQLFWIETDSGSTWGGSIQASTFTVSPDAIKAQAKKKKNQ